MTEGELWPNQGFYLKISDASHAMYVSLPDEQNDMILNNNLQIGQCIYVDKFESAAPVPILRGVILVPGKHPCVGSPEELVANLNGFCSMLSSDTESKKGDNDGVGRKPVAKPRSLSASKRNRDDEGKRKVLPSSIPRLPRNEGSCIPVVENDMSGVVKGLSKISITCSDKDSDSDSSSSSCYEKSKARKSWEGTTTGLRGMSGSIIVDRNIKNIARTRSAYASIKINDNRESSDDCSSTKSIKKRNTCQNSKSVKSSIKQQLGRPSEEQESFNPVTPFRSIADNKWTETTVSWCSLSANLVKLGKEVVRHRDVALVTALEALQEASAAERLIKCLSTYSEIQSSKKGGSQPMVDRFLDFHDDFTQVRFTAQSLSNISPLRSDTNSTSPDSVKEAIKLTSERKKSATLWIKAALASDLSQVSLPDIPTTHLEDTSNTSGATTRCSKPNGPTVRKQRKNGDIQVGLATVKENPTDWVKGSSLDATADLANALQSECRKWFLSYIEKFLDEVASKEISTASDSEVAAVMCQIKKIDNWLEVIMRKDKNLTKDGSPEVLVLEDGDMEACERVRNKLYGVLLKHVERSALALESMDAASQA